MAYKITLIPGDGIGPEVTTAARQVLEATGLALEWDVQPAGGALLETHGTVLPEAVLDSVRNTGVALKGPLTTPIGSGFRSANVALRRALDLYANLRPARTLPGIPHARAGVDLVVVRENTEGLYAGLEHEVVPGEVTEAIRVITRRGCERIARFAFAYAHAHGRRKVTAVHKANVLKVTDGLFLEVARAVAAEYPEVFYEELIVDNMCMQLVLRPEAYDVLVLPNLFGDIVSDLCAGLVGGLGVTPGANLGEGLAVFEPVHGSAPDIAGQDRANPTAAILSGALLLRHLGEEAAADRVETAVGAVIAEGESVTADLKVSAEGTVGDESEAVGTQAMAAAIAARVAAEG